MRQFAVLAVLLLLGPPVAAAATLADVQVGFSADRTLRIDRHAYIGKMWAMPGAERHEQTIGAFRPIFLLHADSPFGEVVLPQLKTVVQFRLPPLWQVLHSPHLTRHPVASAVVDGVATTEYAIDEAAPDGTAQGRLWLSRDGIPMRFTGTFAGSKGKPTRINWQLSHVRVGAQPASLFALPHGYAKLPPEAVAPLLGLKLKSAKRQ